VLENFAQFVNLVEAAMSHTPKSDEDLATCIILIKSFLEGFENFMFMNDPKRFQDVDCASGN
jgi:hypothetical protein